MFGRCRAKAREKSPNWDARSQELPLAGYFIGGSPFEEGFPKSMGAVCEIILIDGKRHRARLAEWTENGKQSLKWVSEDRGDFFEPIVAAWQQIG